MSVANLFNSIQSPVFIAESQFPFSPNGMQVPSPAAPQIRARRFLRQLGAYSSFTIVNYTKPNHSLNSGGEEFNLASLKSKYESSFGTYMLHGELLLSVPEFNDSPYSNPMPWKDDHDSNWNIELKPFGQYRSFFNNGRNGNYENYYDMISISSASSFYSKCKIPQFYSEAGNCSETTYSHKENSAGYAEYKPFFVESCSYSRSYFYGMNY
jgi:hypothetical protein